MHAVYHIPQLTIEADGLPLPPADLLGLNEVRVRQCLSLPTLCEMVFVDPPGPLATADRLAPGTAVQITIQEATTPLFTGAVTAVEQRYTPDGGREIRVRGYDKLHQLRQRQTARAHVQVDLRDLAFELVAPLGLRVEADERGPLLMHLFQHNQTDLDLLTQTTRRYGFYFILQDETFHLLTLSGLGEALPLALGDSLLEARVTLNGDAACREVTAVSWNPLRVETNSGRVDHPRSGREVTAAVLPIAMNGDGLRLLLDESAADDDQATALAQAELDRRSAAEVSLWGVAAGDPALQPGKPIQVSGLAEAVNGRYILTDVTHRIDGTLGYVTELSTLPPPAPLRPQAAGVTLGVVSQISDPENIGRVRLTLPTYGDVETDWLAVLSIGAGRNKGLTILPDVGDQVLALLDHGDPGRGIVLGGFYGMDGPTDSGVEEGQARRYTLQTPGGQRVQLDDTGHVIRLENSRGSVVELTPDRVRLHAATSLEIEAPGQAITIRGQTIDFQQG
jgi:phage baseplate assembly protein gpV/phage protein D